MQEQKTGGNLAGWGERRRMQSFGSLSNGGFERKSFRERKKQETSDAKVKRRKKGGKILSKNENGGKSNQYA